MAERDGQETKTNQQNGQAMKSRELQFDSPLDFRMDLEESEDGERVAREREEQATNRERNESAQGRLFLAELAHESGATMEELS